MLNLVRCKYEISSWIPTYLHDAGKKQWLPKCLLTNLNKDVCLEPAELGWYWCWQDCCHWHINTQEEKRLIHSWACSHLIQGHLCEDSMMLPGELLPGPTPRLSLLPLCVHHRRRNLDSSSTSQALGFLVATQKHHNFWHETQKDRSLLCLSCIFCGWREFSLVLCRDSHYKHL